jgi:hypothetical protein
MDVPLPPPTFYVCPGERHAISRSVHWARLAAFYDKCRDCPHQHDTGLLPARLVRPPQSESALRAVRRTWQLLPGGVRGRYLNDIDRQTAMAWARAFAARLWDDRPFPGRLVPAETVSAPPPLPLRGPVVVAGFDERPASPDVAVGIITGLRQMGCQVLDVGCVTRPMWKLAQEWFHADGGMFVTGAGCDPAWTGWDMLRAGGRAQIDPAELAAESSAPIGRPTRTAGTVATRTILADYRAGLTKWFHALRPLKVVCATPLQLLRDLLPPLFAPLPCQFQVQAWPRQRTIVDALPPGIDRLANVVRETQADVGVLIDEDGATRTLIDEQGKPLPPSVWQPWLQRHVDEPLGEDGVVILGAVLQALSLSDAPFSERLRSPAC